MKTYLVLIALTTVITVTASQSVCEINVKDEFPANQPLILVPDSTKFFLPSDSSGKIVLKKDDKVLLACSDAFNDTDVKTRVVVCSDANKFKDGTSVYEFKAFNCKTSPAHTAIKTTRKCFNDAGVVIEVGFQIDTAFYKSFEICFDESVERTYYVKHEFTAGYKQFQTPPDGKWITGDFYNKKDVDKLYTGVTQKATLSKILGSDAYADWYVNLEKDSQFFLSRGHLAARTDFVFANNQRSTYYFMNAAPQWQIFNGGNWNAIEIGLKDYVADQNIEVDVYTGTYGTISLYDGNNRAHDIFLDFDKNNNGLIPVPKIYYKILVDRKTQKGIVFLGVNNPYLLWLDLQKEYILCKDVSDEVKWINNFVKWERTNTTLGYSYACDVNEFIKVVKYLPDLNVTGLLSGAKGLLQSSLWISFIIVIINMV